MGQLFGCYFVQLYAQASYFRLIACTQLFLYVKVSATLQPYGCDQKTAGHQVRGTARFLFDGGEARCIIYISASTFFESTYSYNFIHLLISSLSEYFVIQNGSEWFWSAGSAVELLCSSMLVYGKFFVHGSHSTYTAYTAVLAQRRSTVAPNFGPLRHQSCQWLNMLWYVVAQCGTMWLTPRLPA
jgi:hypothetical protein